jgi:hypothetical protein
MTQARTAAEIAASIDLTTVTGHNLRALLLRLTLGESLRQEVFCGVLIVLGGAEALGLVDADHTCRLTPLGRDVAEQLRPEPWRVREYKAASWGGVLVSDYEIAQGDRVIPMSARQPDAERIAALLTVDDLREAEQYRTEPTS